MRILFLTQVVPYPLDAGSKVRSYFVLKYLAERHRVTLLTFVRPADRPEDLAHLAELCAAVHGVPLRRTRSREALAVLRSLVSGEPFLITRDQRRAMIAKVDQLVAGERFDAVHAEQLWMAQYALRATGAGRGRRGGSPGPTGRPQLVLDQHDALHVVCERLAGIETNPLRRSFLRREARALATFEPRTCSRFDRVVWVAEPDRRAVAALARDARGASDRVIPIGVDLDVAPLERRADARRLVFIGGMRWPPNAQGILWFAEQVLPAVRARCPGVVLTVLGGPPPAALAGPGIEVLGQVREPLRHLGEAAVFVVPLHAGAGMRVKILDAWRWGLPVVSTTIGAEGIDARPGENVLIADDPGAFTDAVIRLLAQPELAERLRRNGLRTVRESYDWRTLYQKWDEIYPCR